MTATISRRLHDLPALLLAAAAALLVAFMMLPAPAHAHDTLISTDPEDGTSLETSPEQITLTFSADVLDVSPVVRISDEAGDVIEEITPAIEGPNAIATPSEPLPAGTHTIQWRVVSSDGHPIEGTFTITVEQDAESEAPAEPAESEPAESEAPASDAPTEATEADATEADATDTEAADPAEESSSSSMTLLLVIIGVAVLGVALAAFFSLRRRN